MNTIDISYDNISYSKLAPKKMVKDYLNKVLEKIGLSNVEFSVSFVEEEQMHLMNKEYRDIDDSTDILSFAAEDEVDCAFISAGRHKRILGDMVICPPVMARNANTFNVSEAEELHRLLIHGVLHLSGQNHITNEVSQEPMLQMQEKLLLELGY